MVCKERERLDTKAMCRLRNARSDGFSYESYHRYLSAETELDDHIATCPECQKENESE